MLCASREDKELSREGDRGWSFHKDLDLIGSWRCVRDMTLMSSDAD